MLIQLNEIAKIYVKTFVKWLFGHPGENKIFVFLFKVIPFNNTFEDLFLWIKTWCICLSLKRKKLILSNEIVKIFKKLKWKGLLGHPVCFNPLCISEIQQTFYNFSCSSKIKWPYKIAYTHWTCVISWFVHLSNSLFLFDCLGYNFSCFTQVSKK